MSSKPELSTKETLSFQTEVKQVLNLITHFLYSNKEIFLRELLSNASDAADKIRFLALSDSTLLEGDSEFKIRVSFDKTNRTVTISDNGIGMSRAEVIENIGTIAQSGTRRFLESLTGDQAKDANLIGQFGVGFYSAFIVADKVTLRTRRAGTPPDQGVCWESSGEGDYTLESIEKPTRGTEVILHLREGEDEFLNDYRLQSIIRKYSDHISFPVVMKPTGDKDAEEETINQASALWLRSKSEITEDDYNEFYKHVAHDFSNPLTYLHTHVEGRQEYTLLLYIPNRAPFDLWDRDPKHGVKLYVRRVFIMDDAEKMMPRYLRFVRGVIDSNDLPLNVSRELLQQNKVLEAIRNNAVKKVLGLIEDLARTNDEKFTTFWKEFGRVLKEGVGEDFGNQERIAKLLRFSTTYTDSEEQTVTLTDYVSRMKPNQDKIYYVTAESFAAAKNSPHLEVFRKNGIEVLLLTDRVDEWLVSSLTQFDNKQLQSVAKGELDLGKLEAPEEKEKIEKATGDFKDVIQKIKDTLGDKIKDVRLTGRLTSSPACLVSDDNDISSNLERLLKASGQKVMGFKPIMEINPDHPIVQKLKSEISSDRFADWSHILFDQALLAEGGQLDDPASFVHRLNQLFLEMNR
ncbi:MAG TPA: molecular chaperone HtpG [Acidobacteriota bacterium]|nr:molecular chaperone HtpG [Acidobacteriota bacterium]HNG93103.1 molecular chaperone HtpG [Acidobacteriota bacterium]HNH83431.1 molecular chaperone HtpG [Acidobacteriota bacterium]